MLNYFIALVLTEIIELAVAFIMGFQDKFSLLAVVVINLITHSILHLILYAGSFYSLMPINYGTITILEIIVVLAEWGLLVYALDGDRKKLFYLALAMNTASYLTGILIYH